MNQKKITVRENYLELPVSEYVGNHQLCVVKDGRLVDDITVRLDYKNPSACVYFPIGRWMGQEIELSTRPGIEIEDRQTSEMKKNVRGEVFRPFLHFTPEFGWNNDPNGLLKYTSPVTGKTEWHMFYQFNPYDWEWGNMHWGHAKSDDLIHWTHLPVALFPDDDGTMFSGSAIVDRENRSGLKEGEEDVILLFYTCAGNTSVRSEKKPFTQCLAYSSDGGVTFKKYEKNPIVGHIRADNRDPKVIWCEELGKYLMAIYLDKNDYELLVSDNFLEWTPLQTIAIEGDAECPDLYPLPANGDPKKRRWILSGASHHYLVGAFENGQFKPLQGVKRLSYGTSSYAAQTFSTYDEYERIQIAWDREMHFGNAVFKGQMGVPCALSLIEDEDGCTLCAAPVKAIDALAEKEIRYDNLSLEEGNELTVPLDEAAYEIDVTLDPAKTEGVVRIDVFGQTILFDIARNTARVRKDSMPLSTLRTRPELRILVDKGSAEIFASEGRVIMTEPWMLNFNQCTARISSDARALVTSLVFRKLSL